MNLHFTGLSESSDEITFDSLSISDRNIIYANAHNPAYRWTATPLDQKQISSSSTLPEPEFNPGSPLLSDSLLTLGGEWDEDELEIESSIDFSF